MIVCEYTATDTCGRSRKWCEVKCEVCGNLFHRMTRWLKDHTCSAQCVSILKGTRVYVTCAHCGGTLTKQKSDLKNSKSGLYFCNRECKENGQKYIEEIQPDHYGTGTGIKTYRAKALKHYGAKCQLCGYDTNKSALVVHHKNKNRSNNDLCNLMVLCANCHMIIHLDKP